MNSEKFNDYEFLKKEQHMPFKDITYYCSLFEKLRRDKKNGGAPHKPILLISLIQAFQQGIYRTEEISITPELVGLFKSNWHKLVTTNHQCLFTLPFYHMSSESFWNLIPNIGCEIWIKTKSSMRSFANLTTAIKYAVIDDELKVLLLREDESEILLQFILEKYFAENKNHFNSVGSNYIANIQSQIIMDPEEIYKDRLLQIRKELDDDAFQEEVFVRSSIFKKEIPKIYNYTCCISGLRIDATDNITMVDACHIIPFSESYNDTITNGIALCPNLHRAFDRGLIAINKNYQVVLNDKFSEPNKSTYNIKQFEGKEILLPEDRRYFPAFDSLSYHQKKFGFL